MVRRDPARVLALLHPEFVEYAASGQVWDRFSVAAAAAEAEAEAVEPIDASEVRAHRLGPDAFLITDRSHDAGRSALRSSTWLRAGGEWLLGFRQGTVLAEQ